MFKQPINSPWGEITVCDTLYTGVFLIYTDSYDGGGTMVSKDIEEFLSPAARRYALRRGGYLCYGEDTAENIVFRELLDKKLWSIPERIKDKAAFEENINNILREHHPEYWRSREHGRQKTPPERPAPALAER